MERVAQTSAYSNFLQYLTAFPDSDLVARAAARGPLAQFGCQSLTLWSNQNPEELACVGVHGMSDFDFERYSTLPVVFQTPLTESFLASTTIILPITEIINKFPQMAIDQDFWDDATEKNGNGDVGHVPVSVNGTPIGAFAFFCNRLNEWTPKAISILDGLSAALGLWMSHPLSNVLQPPKNASREGLSLTSRQVAILHLVREGKSNASISARLGFSQSTIKQELQWIMKRLKVHTRTEAAARASELHLIQPPPH